MADFKKPYSKKPNSAKPSFRPSERTSSYADKHAGGGFKAGERRGAQTAPKTSAYDAPKMAPKITGRPVLRVDMKQLKANYNALTELVKKPGKPVTIGACVKADAYGLGMGPVAKALYGLGCRTFFVAHASEGRLLREIVGKVPSIFVFNGPSEAEMQIFFGSKLKPVLNSFAQAQLWSRNVPKHEFQPRTAIHIDTGMNRLGMTQYDMAALTENKAFLKALDIELVMSHLACAPNADHPMNAAQLDAFKKTAATLPPLPLSLANSAGIYLGKPYHFQMVRPGAALYGLEATNTPSKEVTKPVVTLAAPILQVKTIQAGASAGYDATFTADKPTRVIIAGAGYADGIPVAASNKSYGTLAGQKLPIIGRVSMDLTILDASGFKGEIAMDSQVEFLGDQLQAQSDIMGGLNYEMLTRLGSRFRREYS